MSKFVKQETRYFVACLNTTTEQEGVMQYQGYNGTYMPIDNLENSTAFVEIEKANKLKEILTMMAQFTGATYEYYVLQEDSDVTKVVEEAETA